MTDRENLAQCTIVIPTRNRPAYLRRAVAWFANLGMPVVVADSSETPSLAEDERARLAAYVHRPGDYEVFVAKLGEAMEAVTTPYVALCADDDLLLPTGLVRSITFLDRNQDYSIAQGFFYQYQILGRRLAVWPMTFHSEDVPHEDWRDRVDAMNATVFYSVQRTAVLRRSLGFLTRSGIGALGGEGISLAEFAMMAITARAGKIHRTPVPFALREYSRATRDIILCRLLVSPLVPAFFTALLDEVAGDAATDPETRLRLLRRFGRQVALATRIDDSVFHSRLGRLPRVVRDHPGRLALVEYLYRWFFSARLFLARDCRDHKAIFRSQDYAGARAALLAGRPGAAASPSTATQVPRSPTRAAISPR